MEDAALIPVEERIHIEVLRLLMENAKLRKILNDYSDGLLRNTLMKSEQADRCPPPHFTHFTHPMPLLVCLSLKLPAFPT